MNRLTRFSRAHGAAAARTRQGGGSLIEVLVSVVVLSIGLFGAAGLQMSALRNNQGSYEHAQLTVLAQGMLDAMRSNPAGLDAGNYEHATMICSAPAGTTLAVADVGLWIGTLKTQINSSACGRITCAARDCQVGIQWDDSRATGGATAQVFTVRSRL